MEIQKFSDFLNEAKKAKGECTSALLDMLKKKPNVTMDKYPDEKGMYSLAGMKKYLSTSPNEFSHSEIGNALGDIQNDKKIDLKTTRNKNLLYKNDFIVYWYIDLDKEEVDKLKEKYEKEQAEKNKDVIAKSIATKKSSKLAAEAKEDVRKEAKEKRASRSTKPTGEKAERKPGAPQKKKGVTRK